MKVDMMQARTLGPIVVLALLLASAFAVPAMGVGHDTDKPLIVCANAILADFTANVVGDMARVEYLMPSGVCPSHYDSRSSDAEMVANADVIVMMGWEGWLSGLIESTGNDEALVIRCGAQGDQNLPEDAKSFVDHIATGLADPFEDDAATLDTNAAAYKAEIDAKDVELKARVEGSGIYGSKVVVMLWQQAFVESLGCEVVGVYGPPEGLSVQDQLNVTSTVASGDVAMVVDNLQSGTEFGSLVASETGREHVVLTNFPSAYPNTYTYLDMIDYNTNALIEGAENYEFKKGEIADLEAEVKDLEYRSGMFLTMAVIFLIVALFLGVLLVRSRSRGD
jgi:ABC-type Zn uptake system ZnuABC Zn-binding protein ZnuA